MKYNGNNLDEVLKAHLRWWNEEDGWVKDDRADLRGADLSSADLSSADLRDADLSSANNIPYIPMACPEVGAFTGYKKAACPADCIVELAIPAEARRSSATGRKCRCDKATVVSITYVDSPEHHIDGYEAVSNHDPSFKYKVGEMVSVPEFDDDRWSECAPGIHFFLNRMEAVMY